MVTLWELGLYALSSLTKAGAVVEDRLVLWWDEADLNGRVGAECLRCRNHAWALSFGNRSTLFNTKTSFFPSLSLRLTSSSTRRLRQPSGSRASKTKRTTSLSSMTLCSIRM